MEWHYALLGQTCGELEGINAGSVRFTLGDDLGFQGVKNSTLAVLGIETKITVKHVDQQIITEFICGTTLLS
jgi:hypothetical protein